MNHSIPAILIALFVIIQEGCFLRKIKNFSQKTTAYEERERKNEIFSFSLHDEQFPVFFTTAVPVEKHIIYVKMNATGDGSSWANATGDLQEALKNAKAGSEIWIAEGTYYPVRCSPCTKKDRAVSFVIPDGAKIIGGFKGKGKHILPRKWQKHPTHLSGNIGHPGRMDNSYTIVTIKNAGKMTVLDGLIISGGQADADASPLQHPHRSGGALYNDGADSSSLPMLLNCLFINNYALEGGAVYNNGDRGDASPAITDCTFTNNKAKYGGAIFNDGENGISNPVITYTQFVSNEADFGPGIFNISSRTNAFLKIFNSTFANNRSEYGGCLYYLGIAVGPKLRTVLFLNNISGNDRKEDITVKMCKGNKDGWMAETYLEEE